MPADGRWDLKLNLLTWRIWWAPNIANRWQMGINSPFKGLKHYFNKCVLSVNIRQIAANFCTWRIGRGIFKPPTSSPYPYGQITSLGKGPGSYWLGNFCGPRLFYRWKASCCNPEMLLNMLQFCVEASWNVMAHTQKSYFVFRAKRTSPFKLA